jgi:hypothetical protein
VIALALGGQAGARLASRLASAVSRMTLIRLIRGLADPVLAGAPRVREEAYPAADRVAGLLILLYAQKLSVITALTARHVLHEDGRTLLRLGSRPIVLPAPLDDLVAGLAAGRRPRGGSLLGVSSLWLFPGRMPGSALTEDALARRLHAHGISPRQGRATALFTLAADVPAAILARTLGIHVQAAIQWQKISAGDWAAYAADVSCRSGHTRRSHTSPPSCSPPDVHP